MPTNIPWTDETWPAVTGCTAVSAGCKNCYAARQACNKYLGLARHPRYKGLAKDGKWTGKVNCNDDVLYMPLHWKKPRRVFVASMGDLFHHAVPFGFVHKVFGVMHDTPQHTYQVLTKRPERMEAFIRSHAQEMSRLWGWPESMANVWLGTTTENQQMADQSMANVWLGTTTENQQMADQRIPHLLECNAAVRFLSLEPLLGPVDLQLGDNLAGEEDSAVAFVPCDIGGRRHQHLLRGVCGRRLDWVIIGCESGPRRRPCQLEWVESLVDQCQRAGVSPFVKQLDINGRVSTNPAEWPEKLRAQQYPIP